MAEFRRDSLTGRWVLLSPERLRRPAPPAPAVKLPKKKFAARLVERRDVAGTTDAVEVHRHLYPALRTVTAVDRSLRAGASQAPGAGQQYMLRFASGADLCAVDSARRVAFAATAADYLARFHADRRVQTISMFRNHGLRAGASLAQPHHQLWALPVPSVDDAAELAWLAQQPTCPTCTLLRRSKALTVASSAQALLLARPAARFGAELLVVPRRHVQRVTALTPAERADVVTMVALGACRIKARYGEVGINELWLERVARSSRLHFRVELLPRINAIAGLELATGLFLNPYQPEKVARELRALRSVTIKA